MCFWTNTSKFKIAKRPIKVYKWLIDNKTPFYEYTYHKGLNKPLQREIDLETIVGNYCFRAGVLHCYKKVKSLSIIPMYILKGTKYNDCGIQSSANEIISTALYWPKNKFEEWWYSLISKKY